MPSFLLLVAVLTAMFAGTARAENSFRDCPDCPEMISIPAGTYAMGSPASEKNRNNDETRHQVTISKPFAVGKFEVTRSQFDRYLEETGDKTAQPCNSGDEAVGCMRWNDAQGYVQWLAHKTGQPYRLLSEAEWEYAARAGTTTAFYWGNLVHRACRYGNVKDQSWAVAHEIPAITFRCKDGYAEVAPVGQFVPNAFGLYDMSGNLWEWTADCWNRDYTGAPVDGSAWTSGDCDSHVLRGGAWGGEPRDVRSAVRNHLGGYRVYSGIRVAKTLP